MSLYSIARNLAVLAVNVVEAVVYSVFDFDRQADELWDWRCECSGRGGGNDAGEGAEPSSGATHALPPRDQETSSAAGPSPEAADDQPPCSVSNQDVEQGGLQTLSVDDLHKAANYAYLHDNEDGLWRRLDAYASYLETLGVHTL